MRGRIEARGKNADDEQAETRAQGAPRAAAPRRGAVRAHALAPRFTTEGWRQIVARAPVDHTATPPKQIDIGDEYQLQYWCRALRVSRTDLVEAVKSVGPSARAVSRMLGKG
jgi:hypothetical protein